MPESQRAADGAQTIRVEILGRSDESAAGRGVVEAAQHLGIAGLTACAVDRLYFLHGRLTRDDIVYLSRELLADPVTETFAIAGPHPPAPSPVGTGEGEIRSTVARLCSPRPPWQGRGRG
jgi:hypothetical protein